MGENISSPLILRWNESQWNVKAYCFFIYYCKADTPKESILEEKSYKCRFLNVAFINIDKKA